MGFMDRAKQMAEQAQRKIDEAQKQFNDSQSAKAAGSAGDGQRFDEHGRPAGDPPAAAEAPPAPVASEPPAEAPSEPAPAREGVDSNPDPFKPLQ